MYTVFIDRDGTINKNLAFPNVNTSGKLQLLPRAAKGIKLLNDIGCMTIVLTNQAGINNDENSLNWKKFEKITIVLNQMIERECGAKLDDTFCCPHTVVEKCACRKPQSGLLKKAMERYPDISIDRSFIIGDRSADIGLGNKSGIISILVLTGHGTGEKAALKKNCMVPDYIEVDLLAAAQRIKKLIK
jgi:D-glycero-D-manno-heptose 1,7-bisphosphate phosphatase